MKAFFYATSLIVIFYNSIAHPECIVSASVDKNSLLVGDTVTLTILLKYKNNESCLIRDDIKFEKFKLISRDLKSKTENGEKIDTYTFVLTPLKLGEVSIPPITIYKDRDAEYRDDEPPLSTQEIKISVSGVIKEDQPQLKDILPPGKVYEKTYLPIYILIGIILLALFMYLLIKHIRKRRGSGISGDAQQTSTPPLSPYEEAISALNVLEEQRLISKMEYKNLYLRLTEILKRFIERFYGFGATEMTTYELTEHLLDHPQPNLSLEEIKNFLSRADLVKFAKFSPEPETAYKDFNSVRNIIERAARPTIYAQNTTS